MIRSLYIAMCKTADGITLAVTTGQWSAALQIAKLGAYLMLFIAVRPAYAIAMRAKVALHVAAIGAYYSARIAWVKFRRAVCRARLARLQRGGL
jgi:hypothetical protein